jgi:alkane 1-monooxygenase
MQTKALKYLSVLTLPCMVALAFTQLGFFTFLPLLYAFGFIPLLELFMNPNHANLTAMEEEMARHDRLYDWVVYAIVPLQYAFLGWFFWLVHTTSGIQVYEWVGLVLSMGIMCGSVGINVAHELGHRDKPYEQTLAKVLLLSSLYMHFFIEHNRGHHKHVSTEEDPASARYNEPIFFFWLRSLAGGYCSAWKLEADRLHKKGLSWLHWKNEMLLFQAIQLGTVGAVALLFSPFTALLFMSASLVGALLLETVNYIEHYGLQRAKKGISVYERVMPHHSWNSDHPIGRLLLFELSRHSDHHYQANRKYQVLRFHEESPQMPTGYPGMMLLALFPPLWFKVMNPKVDRWKEQYLPAASTSL